MPKEGMDIIDEFTYDFMALMLQNLQYDKETDSYCINDIKSDLNDLLQKYDTEEKRQCLREMLQK